MEIPYGPGHSGGPQNDDGRVIKRSRKGGYIVAGNTWSFGNGMSDIYLLKIDENGNLEWTRLMEVILSMCFSI